MAAAVAIPAAVTGNETEGSKDKRTNRRARAQTDRERDGEKDGRKACAWMMYRRRLQAL